MQLVLDDPADPRLDPYTRLRERDLVCREGLFIAEGEVVLRHLIAATHCETLSVLIAEKRKAALAPLLDQLDPQVPVYLASQPVMDQVVGFPIHRGILALGRRRYEPALEETLANLPRRALVLVLVGIANHDNMGGLFRNAAAFGADAILVDPHCCDPLYRKAIRVSVGAALKLPFVRLKPDDDWVGALEKAGLIPYALSPQGKVALADLKRPPRAALVMGAEGPGLPAALLQRLLSVRIDMAPGFDSLNVATASGLALHHMAFGAAKDDEEALR